MSNTISKLSEPKYAVKMEFNIKQEMRDGIKLSADVYRPDAEGQFPVILMRTCYSSTERESALYVQEIETYKYFAKRGYIFVIQDVRGKNNSEGEWYPNIHEAEDGFDTQQWCGTQEWSNGNVGTLGGSYLAWTQWYPAVLRNPHLKTMISLVAPNDPFTNMPYRGGAFSASLASWGALVDGRKNQSLRPYDDIQALYKHRPIIEMDRAFGRKIPWWKDWVQHPTYDSYWKAQSVEGTFHEIDVPVLHITGWFDDSGVGTRTNFEGMRVHGRTEHARKNQKLLVGPWMHRVNRDQKLAGIDFGPGAIIDLQMIELRWFDYWLKGIDNGIMDEPLVHIFIMGENKWRHEKEWSIPNTKYSKFYLHSQGHANSLFGDGALNQDEPSDEPPDIYIFDPEDPVLVAEPEPFQIGGPADQRPMERRNDVLVYRTPILHKDIEVTGSLLVKLYAATDTKDTDFTATLVDVFPNGYAMWLNDGIIRARYRDSFEHPTLLEPGKIYAYTIDLWWTSNLFKKGHQIGLEIASSRFPANNPNPNTGRDIGIEIETIRAQQTIYHDRAHPSHVMLPIIPRE